MRRGSFRPTRAARSRSPGDRTPASRARSTRCVGRKGLARTSRTPGATRLINFFELDARTPARRPAGLRLCGGAGRAAPALGRARRDLLRFAREPEGGHRRHGRAASADARTTARCSSWRSGTACRCTCSSPRPTSSAGARHAQPCTRSSATSRGRRPCSSFRRCRGRAWPRLARDWMRCSGPAKKKPRLAQRSQPGKTNPVLGDDRVAPNPGR